MTSQNKSTRQIKPTNKIDASFQHIYGHQTIKLRGYMSMEAKLNLAADILAGKYQDQLASYRPVIHMYPSASAVLEINRMTTTSNIRHQFIKAYTEPRYIQCLQSKYNWTKKLVQSIAWKCVNLGLKRIDRKVVLVKICNDLLPTATTLQKWKLQAQDS